MRQRATHVRSVTAVISLQAAVVRSAEQERMRRQARRHVRTVQADSILEQERAAVRQTRRQTVMQNRHQVIHVRVVRQAISFRAERAVRAMRTHILQPAIRQTAVRTIRQRTARRNRR